MLCILDPKKYLALHQELLPSVLELEPCKLNATKIHSSDVLVLKLFLKFISSGSV